MDSAFEDIDDTPLDKQDLLVPPSGERVRGGRVVKLVKRMARAWAVSREFGELVKADLTVFQYIAWSMRVHIKVSAAAQLTFKTENGSEFAICFTKKKALPRSPK